MERSPSIARRLRVAATVAALTVIAAACGKTGTPVSANSHADGGQSGLAFVILVLVVVVFVFTIFAMDRIRRQRSDDSEH